MQIFNEADIAVDTSRASWLAGGSAADYLRAITGLDVKRYRVLKGPGLFV